MKCLNILPDQILMSYRDLFPIIICNIHLITSDNPQIHLISFPVIGSTGTIGLSAPTGLVANDLSYVVFLVFFDVDDEGVANFGGGGG